MATRHGEDCAFRRRLQESSRLAAFMSGGRSLYPARQRERNLHALHHAAGYRLTGQPHQRLFTLTNPGDRSEGERRFTAPANRTLEPRASYFVVAVRSDTSAATAAALPGLGATASYAEDGGSTAGAGG